MTSRNVREGTYLGYSMTIENLPGVLRRHVRNGPDAPRACPRSPRSSLATWKALRCFRLRRKGR